MAHNISNGFYSKCELILANWDMVADYKYNVADLWPMYSLFIVAKRAIVDTSPL